MANSYSIEIGGRFNAAQLQQALNMAAQGKLSVNVSANVQAVQKAVNDINNTIRSTGGVDVVTQNGLNRVIQVKNATGSIVAETKQWQSGVAQTLTEYYKLDKAAGELALKTTKEVTNYRQLNAEKAKLNQANARELEILQRRLGLLQKGINLSGASNSQILSAMGLSPNATITQNGAVTPTAGGGTWDRYIASVQEGAARFHNYTIAVNQATGATRMLDNGITATNKALAAQGETWDRLIVKVAKWALLTSLIYAPVRAFKEALKTMKEVDSELVTIQKVTDLTARQIDSLTASVYSMASAYGRTADELLTMTATFARAGFQDNLEQMTELSALLQNVGDLSAEDASKFLIAANAAWKLEGNYDSLMQIIDGMNEVTNKSANDMQGLTDAITVAGSVFSNAGESAQTFTAMVGTVIASTQRSGSEVARGLRTIAMNIRNIKGELEDGEIIDEQSISDAAKALHSIGVSVSENGELRKVSDVLGDLADKWDGLTTAEQSYVASNLAGKRQANVLIALMSNYAEYEKELQNYADGAGSAMRENEIYLDSWEAKTAILKSTWTEFVAGLVETKAIKVGLDTIIKAIDLLNNGIVQTTVKVASLVAILNGIGTRFLGMEGVGSALTFLPSVLNGSMTVGAMAVGTTMPFIAAAAAVAGLLALVGKLTVTLEEQNDVVIELQRNFDSLYGSGSEYDRLLHTEEELTEQERKRLAFLEAQKTVAEEQLDIERRKLFLKYRLENAPRDTVYAADGTIIEGREGTVSAATSSMVAGYGAARAAYDSGKISADEYKHKISELIDANAELYQSYTETFGDFADEFDDDEQSMVRFYDFLLTVMSQFTTTTEVAAEKTDEMAERFFTLQTEIGEVAAAIDEYNEKGKLSQDTLDGLLKRYPDLITKIERTTDGYTVADGELEKLIADYEKEAKQVEYYAKNAAIAYVNALDSQTRANNNLGLAVNATTQEIMRQMLAVQALAAVELNRSVITSYGANLGGEVGRNATPGAGYEQAAAKLRDINNIINNLKSASAYEGIDWSKASTSTSKGSSGGSSSTKKDTTVSDAIKAKKAEFDYAIWLSEQQQGLLDKDTQAYKDKTAEQAEYYVAMQEWAHKEADKLRGIDAKQYKDEIQELQKYWWEAQNWLVKNTEDTMKTLRSNVKEALSQLKDDLDDQTDQLDAQISKVKALIDLEEQYNEIQKDVRDEQHNIDEQLKIAKESYQYLDDETRKLLFNEKDYAVLSAKLRDIQKETSNLYDEYVAKVSKLNKDNVYQAEALTEQYSQQLAAKQKEYEIAKANLALAKAQTQLQNAQNNRNTLMLIDGQFQWVADPKAVKSALEELEDAEYDAAESRRELTETEALNMRKAEQTELELQKSRIEAEYKAISTAWNRLSESMETPVLDIQQTLAELAENAAPEFKAQIESLSAMIATLTGEAVAGGTSSKYDGMTYSQKLDAMSIAHGISKVKNAPVDENEVIRIANEHGVDLGVATSMAAANQSAGRKLYDAGGVARGTGVMLKGIGAAEGVLSPSVMAQILNPEKNALFNTFVSSLTALFGGGTGGVQLNGFGASSSLIDNSITVNGMEVVGRKGENLAEAARAILPIYTGGRI